MFAILSRAVEAGLYLLLATPLFFGKSFMFPFLTPKVFVFQALVELVFAGWLALAIFDPKYRPRLTWLTGTLGLFLLALTLSSLFGLDLHRSFWSTQGRGLGLVALYHFAAWFLVLSSWPALNWRKYLTFSFGVSLVTALFAFFQIYNQEFFLEQVGARPGSFLGNPSFLAAYLLFNIFYGLYLAAEKWADRRLWSSLFLAGTALEVFVLFLTQTRGAILGLGAGIAALLVYLALSRDAREWFGLSPETMRKWARVLLAAGLVFSAVFWFTRTAPVWQAVPGLDRFDTLDVGPRILTLGISWNAFQEKPLLGFGFENFKYAFDKRYDPRLLRYGFTETYFDKPHNVIVETAISGGLLGLLLYLGLFAAFVRTLFRSPALRSFLPFGLAAAASYLVQNLFLFDTFGSYLMFFALLALADAHDPKRAEPVSARMPAWPAWTKPALAAVLLLAAAYPVYALNWNGLYSNNRQYWGLNWFVNRRADLAIEAYVKALTTPPLAFAQPYKDAVRHDFATTFTQIYEQGVEIDTPFIVAGRVLQDLNTVITNHPNDYFPRTVFADVASVFYVFNAGYLDAAKAHLAEAQKSSPLRQQIYYARARIALVEKKPDEAMDLMRQAVELDPESPDPHFYYGLTALQAGETELGFAEINKAGAMGRIPKNASEARILANYFGDAGRYEDAVALYGVALAENPDDLESRIKLGLVYYYWGKGAEARRELSAVAKAVDLTQSPYYSELKEIYADLGIPL